MISAQNNKNRIKLYTIKSKQLKKIAHLINLKAYKSANNPSELVREPIYPTISAPTWAIWSICQTTSSPDQQRQRHVCLTVSKQYGCVRAREWCSSFCWPIQKSSNQTTNHPSNHPYNVYKFIELLGFCEWICARSR